MIVGNDYASKLRGLKENDLLDINGEKYEICSIEELINLEQPKQEHETRNEGMKMELKKPGTDAFAPKYSLSFNDIETEYKRIGVFDGPPPLNSNPKVMFVQDAEANKNYKYSITKRARDKIEIKFLKEEEKIEVKSLKLPSLTSA